MTFLGLSVVCFGCTVAAVGLHWLYHLVKHKMSRLPPGPLPLPFIGNAYFFYGRRWADVMKELRQKYGDVITLHINTTDKFVMFLGYEVTARVFNGPNLANIVAGRSPLMSEARKITRGVVWADWPEAREPRKFVLRTLKDFGLTLSGNASSGGKNGYILDEMDSLVKFIEENGEKPVQPHSAVQQAMASCIVVPLLGRSLDFTDPLTSEMYTNGKQLFESSFNQIFFSLFSKLHGFFNEDLMTKGELRMEEIMEHWLATELESRRKTFNFHDPTTDFIDAFLAREQRGDTEPYSLKKMQRILVDLFLAGMDTTSQVFLWQMFYLAHNPEWQDKLFDEISKVAPGCFRPDLKYRSKLPLLEAVTNEVLRYGTLVGYVFPHSALKTFEVDMGDGTSYEIPENMQVTYAIELMLKDEEFWKDSDTFKPERWLTKDGKLVNHPNLVALGIGKRHCIGEAAARCLIFMCTFTLVKRFKWKLATPVPINSCCQMANRNPPDFRLTFSLRG